MSSQTRLYVICLFFTACVGALSVLVWNSRSPVTAAATSSTAMDTPATRQRAVLSAGGKATESGGSRTSVAEAVEEPVTLSTAPEGSSAERVAAVIEEMKPALADSFEASLLGMMEPKIFMELALQLVQLEIDPQAIPEPDSSGAIRFSVIGTPPGISAQLWIKRTTNPKFAEDVMSLRVSLDPSSTPYILEGASRRPPELVVSVWRDPQGSVKNIAILTDIFPDDQNRKLGLPVDGAEIPTGMHYTIFAGDPSRTVARVNGMVGVSAATLERDVVLGPEPSTDDVQALNAGLIAMYHTTKK